MRVPFAYYSAYRRQGQFRVRDPEADDGIDLRHTEQGSRSIHVGRHMENGKGSSYAEPFAALGCSRHGEVRRTPSRLGEDRALSANLPREVCRDIRNPLYLSHVVRRRRCDYTCKEEILPVPCVGLLIIG